jgi:hypothetical protein
MFIHIQRNDVIQREVVWIELFRDLRADLQQNPRTLRVCDVIDLGVDSKGSGAEK